MNNTPHTVALITGASQGLGLSIARLYTARGIGLVLTARSADRLYRARDELAKGRQVLGRPRNVAAGDEIYQRRQVLAKRGEVAASDEVSTSTTVVALPGDVGEEAHRQRLVAEGLRKFGHIDVLINNASELGPSPMPTLEQLEATEFERILRVNVIAPLRLAQLLLPAMRKRRSGVIVNVTSDAGVQAYPGWGGYGSSKAALEHLSRVLAAELEGSGVHVYVVDPGDMNTQMHRLAEPGVDLSHLPGPEQVAPVFLDLLNNTAPFERIEAQWKIGAEI